MTRKTYKAVSTTLMGETEESHRNPHVTMPAPPWGHKPVNRAETAPRSGVGAGKPRKARVNVPERVGWIVDALRNDDGELRL